jgi:hypothetical protein
LLQQHRRSNDPLAPRFAQFGLTANLVGAQRVQSLLMTQSERM